MVRGMMRPPLDIQDEGPGRGPLLPRVCVVGGGVAGLACAARLAARGVPVDVFDQGSRGVGGRSSSSRPVTVAKERGGRSEGEPQPAPEPLTFDHGCQFFTATDPAFKAACEALRERGCVEVWDGVFGWLDAGTGAFTPKRERAAPAGEDRRFTADGEDDFFGLLSADEVFVGAPAMTALCEGLRETARDAVGHWHVTVTRLELAPAGGGGESERWIVAGVDRRQLDEGEAGSVERILGRYAAVVVSDVMLAKKGTPGSCQLLMPAVQAEHDVGLTPGGDDRETRDGYTETVVSRAWAAMERQPPSSLFSLMVAFPTKTSSPNASPTFDAAVVTGSEVVQLLVRHASKPGRGARTDGLELWTAVSTRRFAERIVADAPLSVNGEYNPQTAAYLEAVTPTMVEEVRRVLGLAEARKVNDGSATVGTVPDAVHAKSQRWGNAFPLRPMAIPSSSEDGVGMPFVWDRGVGFAACGDFVAGAGIEAAFLSGEAAGAVVADVMLSRWRE